MPGRHALTIEIPETLLDAIGSLVRQTVQAVLAERGNRPTPRADGWLPGSDDIPEAKGLIDTRSACELLSLSSRTIWRLQKDGLMPKSIRLGKSVRWNQKELEEWMWAGCPSAAEWEKMKTMKVER